jgi:hypothetical protein
MKKKIQKEEKIIIKVRKKMKKNPLKKMKRMMIIKKIILKSKIKEKLNRNNQVKLPE